MTCLPFHHSMGRASSRARPHLNHLHACTSPSDPAPCIRFHTEAHSPGEMESVAPGMKVDVRRRHGRPIVTFFTCTGDGAGPDPVIGRRPQSRQDRPPFPGRRRRCVCRASNLRIFISRIRDSPGPRAFPGPPPRPARSSAPHPLRRRENQAARFGAPP